MKATSIFGGVQVINILITLIRGKFVAILIGTAGMGLNGLLMTGLNFITSLSSLGVSDSAVKDIAKAHNSGDIVHIRTTFQVFKRLIWFTAFLGITATLIFSPLLSKFSFDDGSKTTSFMWLSITFVFGALSGGIYTLLRGTRQLKYLAQANVFGGIVGLLVALPIFYFFGIDGVVPAIILTAFANYLVSLYFRSKIKFEPIAISWQQTYSVGKPIVLLGLSMTFVNILAAGVAFILNAFISKTGSLSDVGLFSAGNAIVTGYVGMVFAAMSTDYFPRLAGVINDDLKWKKLVNEQAELVLIILGIVLIILLTTTPLLIRILLSKEFSASQNFIQFAVLAIPLKGIVWVLGYVLLAKGNNKLFITVEIIANLIILGLNLLFYNFYGLTGLGMSLGISYAISVLFMTILIMKKYDFQFTNEVFKLLFFSLTSLILALLALKFLVFPYMYVAHFAIVLSSVLYFGREFNSRINIKEAFQKIRNKFNKK